MSPSRLANATHRCARQRLLAAVVLLGALTLVGIGCGDDSAGSAATTASRSSTTAATATTTATTTAAPAAPTSPQPDKRLFILSDSVMLGALQTVPAALPGWKVTFDGEESRFITAAVEDLRARQQELGPVVMVQLGNNYDGDEHRFAEQMGALYDLVGPDRTLILLRVVPFEENRAEVNAVIDALAAAHPNVRVADWPAVVAADPSLTTKDGLHLKPLGTEAMAEFVRRQVEAVPASSLLPTTTTTAVAATAATATSAPTTTGAGG